MAGKEVTENRDKYIGGSDIPIIMGLSPFKTRYQLLLEKAHLKDVEEVSNPAIDYGNTMEPILRRSHNYWEIPDVSKPFKPNTICDEWDVNKIPDDELSLRYNADGENEDAVLEIKTTSQIHDSLDGYKHYLVQLLFGMYMFEHSEGVLIVYERPEDYSTEIDPYRCHTYYIDADEYKDLMDEILAAIEQFRADFKRIKHNPFLTEEDLLPAEVVETSHKVIALEEKLAEFKQIEKQYKDLTDQLYTLMKENGIKKWETPNGVKITLVEPLADKIESRFNEEAFKESHPKLYNQYLKETTKKGRKGYIKITL